MIRVLIYTKKRKRLLSEQEAKIVGEVLKISSEVHSFEKIDNIFALVLESLENLFADIGFGVVMEPSRTENILYSKYNNLDKVEQAKIEECHHRILATQDDAKIFARSKTCFALHDDKGAVADIMGSPLWTVFAGVVYAQSQSKGVTHRLKLFVKGEINPVNFKVIQILFDQIMSIARLRFQADELEKVVNTDALTGAYNRFYFDRSLATYDVNDETKKSQYCIVYCDINGLKKVNDEHGHQAGDSLICGAVQLIASVCRESDLLFRLGGDEIVIFCPDTSVQTGGFLVDRIKQKVKDSSINVVKDVELIVSLSFGIADSSEGRASEVVELADRRMFANKTDIETSS